jgi:translation initiation factor IF-3
VKEFLEQGNKVKLTIMFRGRELAHPEFGRDLLTRVVEDLEGYISEVPDLSRTRLEGRNMSVVLAPAKKMPKKEHEEEQEQES